MRSAATSLKRRELNRAAAEARQAAGVQLALQGIPEVQIASTAAVPMHPSTSQCNAQGLQVPSFAPAKLEDEQQPQDEDDGWGLADGDRSEDDSEAAFQVQGAEDIVKQSEVLGLQRQAESNKENEVQFPASPLQRADRPHMIDPQADAKKIEFDSQDSNSNNQQSQMDDLSQDLGFQQLRQPADTAQRPAMRSLNKPLAPGEQLVGRSPAKRARFQHSPRMSVEQPACTSRVLQEHTSKPSQTQVYNEANAQAKIRVACQPKRIQTRKPWSTEEIDTLLDLIRGNGVSYALLKKLDVEGILEGRDQVALKDKARNIKMDFLKAGTFLPKNFEHIPLSKPLVDRLESIGIEYDKETGHRVDGIFEGRDDEDED
ncbi:MAG: hypothetical protein Q9217_003509 [Psora testacea]